MRTALYSATKTGDALAKRLAILLDGEVDRYVSARRADSDAKSYESLNASVEENFPRYDAMIFVMATGIVVRMIAPHVKDKLKDPAILVLDEGGNFVISLLSGHIGGANLLARRVANQINATPVITTATDVQGKIAVDVVAAELALRPEPRTKILEFNSALLEEKEIHYIVDEAMLHAAFYREQLKRFGISVVDEAVPADGRYYAILTEQTEKFQAVGKQIIFLMPRKLIAGVGCKKGTTAALVNQALKEACGKIGRTKEQITIFASTAFKAQEIGLLTAVKEMGKDIVFFEDDVMKKTIETYGLTESPFVKKTLGFGNVCEAAALSLAREGRIALPKTKFEKVTVALIWEK